MLEKRKPSIVGILHKIYLKVSSQPGDRFSLKYEAFGAMQTIKIKKIKTKQNQKTHLIRCHFKKSSCFFENPLVRNQKYIPHFIFRRKPQRSKNYIMFCIFKKVMFSTSL